MLLKHSYLQLHVIIMLSIQASVYNNTPMLVTSFVNIQDKPTIHILTYQISAV